MKIEIIDNFHRELISILPQFIEQSIDVRIAVAFVSRRGIALIENSIDSSLNRGSAIEFLVGLDMHTTEPEALKFLYKLSQSNNNVELYCYASIDQSSIYHPKLYLLSSGQDVNCIVGSSNLTEGGLKKNIEVNIVIKTDINKEIISDCYNTYNRLKFHPKRVKPDDDFINIYSELCKLENKNKVRYLKDRSSRKLLNNFKDKAKSLQHPKPSRKDLVGWVKLVFDHLPEIEFTTYQVYKNEPEFSRFYPENQNIRAKIRQQLQILRDMGLIKHIGKSRWIKASSV